MFEFLRNHLEIVDFSPTTDTRTARDIGQGVPPLVIKFGALGDMILTTPLIRALYERHGIPCEVVGRGDFVPDIYRNQSSVSKVIIIQSNKTPYCLNRPKKELVSWLKQRNNQIVYMAQSDNLSQRILNRARVTATATDLTVLRYDNEHVIDHMARMARFVDEFGNVSKDYNRGVQVEVTEDEIIKLNHWLKSLRCHENPYILVQAGYRKYMRHGRKKLKSKHWPELRWKELIQLILKKYPQIKILLTGSGNECSLTTHISSIINDERVVPVAGQLNVRRLFALISQAKGMISVDTGAAHAAAAVNCPLVVLFGQTDPRVNRPISRNSPVVVVTGPENAPVEDCEEGWSKHHSMEGIAVNKVFEAWESITHL